MNRQKQIHGATKPDLINPGRALVLCACGDWFSLPRCHAERHKSCSSECASKRRAEERASRYVNCAQCDKAFLPRPWQIKTGIGRFCSVSCSTRNFRLSPSNRVVAIRSGQTYRRNLAAGKFTRKKGESHPQWMGGPAAARRRQTESGKASARLRAYRKRNPHKAKEWADRRSSRKRSTGRLPRGTVSRLFANQRGRCAYCEKKLKPGYHLDHIMPLARGGAHESSNLQLLCGPCNVRKSAKDPIVFAQQIGMLL